MKKIISLCFAALLLSCSQNEEANNATNTNQAPSIDEVLYHIYTTYEVKKELSPNERLQIMKTPKGWEVGIRYYDAETKQQEVKDQTLLWSDNAYQTLDFSTKKEEPKDKALMSELYQTLGFHNNSSISRARVKFKNKTFYGYEGWIEDILNYYSENEPSTDLDKYNFATAKYDKVFSSEDRTNIPASDVFQGLSLLKTIQNNNSIQTVVGQVNLKYANDVIGIYLNNQYLDLGFNKEKIESFMAKDLYPKEAILFAKTLLASCPQGAILFTSGDNDTFPLIYLQKVMGYRTDVQIINRSLLQSQEYIRYLRDKGIQMSVDAELYQDDLSSYFIIEAPRIENAADYLSNLSVKTAEVKEMNGERVPTFPVGLKTESFGTFMLEGQLFNRSSLAGIDIMLSNDRAICFANGYNIFNMSNKKFDKKGVLMIYKEMYTQEFVDQLLTMSDSVLTSPMMKEQIDFKAENNLLTQISFSYYNLLSNYTSAQNEEKRDKLLNFYFEKFNPKQFHTVSTNYILGLMYKSYFGDHHFEENFKKSKDYLMAEINQFITKPIDEITFEHLEKVDGIVSEYTFLKNIEPTKIPDYESTIENMKEKIDEIITQRPHFKIFILESRNLRLIFQEKNS